MAHIATVKTKFWPWRSGESPQNDLHCSLFAEKQNVGPSSLDGGGGQDQSVKLRGIDRHVVRVMVHGLGRNQRF